MNPLLTTILIVVGIFALLGFIGSIARWARGLINAIFSIVGLLTVVFVVIYFMSEQGIL